MFSAIHEHRWISVNINTKCVAFLNQQRLVVELMSQQWIHFWLYMLYSYPEFIYLEMITILVKIVSACLMPDEWYCRYRDESKLLSMFKDIDVLFALGQHTYFHFYSVNSQDQQFVIDMSPKSDTLSRFRGSQSLLLFLIAAWYNLQTPTVCSSLFHILVCKGAIGIRENKIDLFIIAETWAKLTFIKQGNEIMYCGRIIFSRSINNIRFVGTTGACKIDTHIASISNYHKCIPYICIANKTSSQNIVHLETDVIFFVNFNQYGHTNTLDTNKWDL